MHENGHRIGESSNRIGRLIGAAAKHTCTGPAKNIFSTYMTPDRMLF